MADSCASRYLQLRRQGPDRRAELAVDGPGTAVPIARGSRYRPLASDLEMGQGSVPDRPSRLEEKVKAETDELVVELRNYIESQPSRWGANVAATDEMWRKEKEGVGEEEITALWNQQTREVAEASEREGHEFAGEFGGRGLALIHQFKRRTVLTDADAGDMEWRLAHGSGLVELANKFGGLSRQL
jgi:hypothetical protein